MTTLDWLSFQMLTLTVTTSSLSMRRALISTTNTLASAKISGAWAQTLQMRVSCTTGTCLTKTRMKASRSTSSTLSSQRWNMASTRG